MAALSFGTIKIVSAEDVTSNIPVSENIAAGELVYYDSDTSTYKKADKTAAANDVVGFAPVGVNSGNTGVFLGDDSIVTGASLTLTPGTVYYCEGGAFVPYADLGAGDYVTQVAVAIDTTMLRLKFVATGTVL